MTGNIVWIASYPKSGNTWFRAFIANLLTAADAPVHINSLAATNGNARRLFDAWSGIDSVNLLPEEADRLRPEVYKMISASLQDVRFLKVHDAYQYLPDGRAFFPPEATRCTIYIVRNPLDIVPSYAHFLAQDFDRIILWMNEAECFFNRERSDVSNKLSQRMSSWRDNVLSWLDAPACMKVHLMRYEDMLNNPVETFGKAAIAMGMDRSEEEIRRAIAFSSFERLKEMELKEGFMEKPPQAGAFFRQGKSGSWRESLSHDQVSAVVENNKSVMQRLGYLDATGNVVGL